jgi:hypothetical protein
MDRVGSCEIHGPVTVFTAAADNLSRDIISVY